MAEISTGKKSFLAMFLSLICPGLGQFYLRKPLKGLVLFFGTVIGILLVYVNSLPVDSVTDIFLVTRKNDGDSGGKFKLMLQNPESKDYEHTISVILRSSDFKNIEKEIEQDSINVFDYSILLILMDTKSFEKTQTYKTINKLEKRDLKFGPIWQFRISGSVQALFFWVYSIWDGFLGYKGYKRRKKKGNSIADCGLRIEA